MTNSYLRDGSNRSVLVCHHDQPRATMKYRAIEAPIETPVNVRASGSLLQGSWDLLNISSSIISVNGAALPASSKCPPHTQRGSRQSATQRKALGSTSRTPSDRSGCLLGSNAYLLRLCLQREYTPSKNIRYKIIFLSVLFMGAGVIIVTRPILIKTDLLFSIIRVRPRLT